MVNVCRSRSQRLSGELCFEFVVHHKEVTSDGRIGKTDSPALELTGQASSGREIILGRSLRERILIIVLFRSNHELLIKSNICDGRWMMDVDVVDILVVRKKIYPRGCLSCLH